MVGPERGANSVCLARRLVEFRGASSKAVIISWNEAGASRSGPLGGKQTDKRQRERKADHGSQPRACSTGGQAGQAATAQRVSLHFLMRPSGRRLRQALPLPSEGGVP